MKQINQFKLEFKSVPENVAFARVTVAAFASQLDYTLNELDEIKVAVAEAVTNCIVHAYQGDYDQTVQLTVLLTEAGIEIKVEDTGCGIADLEQAMQPAYSTDSERMGLGFTFMQSFMDRLQVDSTPGRGTAVVMFKKLNALENPEH